MTGFFQCKPVTHAIPNPIYLFVMSYANDKNIPEGIVIFSFLTSQQKGKRNNKLCDLCASVVIKRGLPIG